MRVLNESPATNHTALGHREKPKAKVDAAGYVSLTVAPVVVRSCGYHGEVDGVVVRVDVGDTHLDLLAHLMSVVNREDRQWGREAVRDEPLGSLSFVLSQVSTIPYTHVTEATNLAGATRTNSKGFPVKVISHLGT